jgi:hypothetical protein
MVLSLCVLFIYSSPLAVCKLFYFDILCPCGVCCGIGCSGREDLFQVAGRAVSAQSDMHDLLVQSPNFALRDAVALVAVYAAYLTGAHDGSYRRSFELLFAAATMQRSAEAYYESYMSSLSRNSSSSSNRQHAGRRSRSSRYSDEYEEEEEEEDDAMEVASGVGQMRGGARGVSSAYRNDDDDGGDDNDDDTRRRSRTGRSPRPSELY